MKVVCKTLEGSGLRSKIPDEFLTIDKVYDVIHTKPEHYYIKTNKGIELYVHKQCFITIQEFRELKINKILYD